MTCKGGLRSRGKGIYQIRDRSLDFLTYHCKMGRIAEARQAIQGAPKGIFNGYVFMCACVFAFSGISKGFDEGKKQ